VRETQTIELHGRQVPAWFMEKQLAVVAGRAVATTCETRSRGAAGRYDHGMSVVFHIAARAVNVDLDEDPVDDPDIADESRPGADRGPAVVLPLEPHVAPAHVSGAAAQRCSSSLCSARAWR